MTSGHFASFPVDQIYVIREGRQRKELTNIEELAGSIAAVGLIHPPVIERDGQLRVGERRWTAIKSLGWTHMPVQFVDELDEAALQLLELEENLKRVALPWQDECISVAKYHALRLDDDETWTIERTADMLGMSATSAADRINVHKQMEAGNQRVLEAPKFSVAKNVTVRVRERAAQSAVTAALATRPNAEKPKEREVPLLLADFNEWAPQYSGEPFNMLHCDFPYGVNADKHDQGQAAAQGGYKDDFHTYQTLLTTLGVAMWNGNLVAQSAHLIFWFSMDYYQFTKDALEVMGWKVNPFPLVWYKSDNTGILPDPQRGPRRNYETAFLASRGDRKLTARGAVSNVAVWPGKDKSLHMSEKPQGMLKHFMGMVVDEHSNVLDPTAGSANALKVATSLGAPRVLGLEALPEFYQRSKEAYYAD